MIEIKNLSVNYDGTIAALNDISYQFDQHCTVIIGENGSGKSTLLQSIVGTVEFSGNIMVDGIKDVDKIREHVGMIFQNPDHQLFMNNVYEDLDFGLINQGLSEEERKNRIAEVSKILDIEHLLTRSIHKLSGGQKRMAGIGTVLVMQPDYILMDEPTSFLDPKSRRQLINLIKNLDKKMIISTHDLDMALDIADEIVLLNQGKIIASGSLDLLKDQALLEAHGLELPFRYQ